MSPSEICGVSRNVMPTSRRSIWLKVFERLVSFVARLVTNGTFWPTTISASSLSVVRIVGAERTFTPVSFSSAVTTATSAGISVPSASTTFCLLIRAPRKPPIVLRPPVSPVVMALFRLVMFLRFVRPSATRLPICAAP